MVFDALTGINPYYSALTDPQRRIILSKCYNTGDCQHWRHPHLECWLPAHETIRKFNGCKVFFNSPEKFYQESFATANFYCNIPVLFLGTIFLPVNSRIIFMNTGLFVPLHFHSRERNVHRENFHSRGTIVPWNIRSLELSFLGSEHYKVSFLRNYRSIRIFKELSLQMS